MAKVSVGMEPFFNLEIDLVEFINIVKDLVNIGLDNQSKEFVKDAIAEVYLGYEVIVNTITPFLRIQDDENFKNQYIKEYEKFVNIRLRTYTRKYTTCHTVYDMFDKLSNDKSWKTRLPGAQNKLDRLKVLADNWFLNDERVLDILKTFHSDLQAKFDEIYYDINNKPISDSWKELQDLLQKEIPDLDNVQTVLLQLTHISSKL